MGTAEEEIKEKEILAYISIGSEYIMSRFNSVKEKNEKDKFTQLQRAWYYGISWNTPHYMYLAQVLLQGWVSVHQPVNRLYSL